VDISPKDPPAGSFGFVKAYAKGHCSSEPHWPFLQAYKLHHRGILANAIP